MGQRIIALNSYQACTDLLEKSIYSDRTRLYVLDKLMGLGNITTFASYGDTLKQHRKLLRSALSKTAVVQYEPMQIDKVQWYLSTLLSEPAGFLSNLRLLTGGVVLKAAYGVDVESVEDKYIVWSKAILDALMVVARPRNIIYSIFPALLHIPFLPGIKLKELAHEIHRISDQLLKIPFEVVKAEIAAGTSSPSVVSASLNSGGYSDEDIKFATGTLYLAGVDTVGLVPSRPR